MCGVRLAACGVVALTGCAAPRINTTMLTSADVVRMTNEMGQSLAASPAIAARTAASPRWVFTMDKVANRTEHVMSDAEKWGAIARFRAKLAESLVAKEKNIAFVMPAAEWQQFAADGFVQEQARLTPTHTLRAEFRSDTMQSITARSDSYLCAFQLLDLRTGELIWENAYEVKYAVRKNSFD